MAASIYEFVCETLIIANVHDATVTAELLTGEEQIIHGGSGYLGAEKRFGGHDLQQGYQSSTDGDSIVVITSTMIFTARRKPLANALRSSRSVSSL